MTAALVTVASGGLVQVAVASLRVLEWAAVVAGIVLPLRLLLRRRRRSLRTPTQPNPVAEFWARDCPWCDSHECLDKTLCNCEMPCGSWLCVVKEEAR